jgi:hypothetical protein
MKLDWQKLLVIILFIASVFLFGFFIYWFFWRPLIGPSVTTTTTTTTPVGGLTESGTAGSRTTTPSGTGLTGAEPITQIIDVNPSSGVATSRTIDANVLVANPSYFSSINKAGEICYFNPKDGKIYKTDSQGNVSALSEQVFYSVSNAIFNANCDKAILQYPDGSNTSYDFSNDKQYTLPKHWQDFSFSSTGGQITFKNIGLDVENRFLVASNYDGTQAKIIEQIGENAYKINTNWSPNNQVVATYVEGLDASRSEVFFIGQNNENFKSMIVEGRDFRGVWSPTGNRMLYSVYDPNNNYKPALWISDAYGENTGANRLKINLETWADKCTFAGNNYALCVAPQTMPNNAGLDPKNTTADIDDSVWAIDLTNGTSALVAIPKNIKKIENIYYSSDSPNDVFLVNAANSYIYKINIQ